MSVGCLEGGALRMEVRKPLKKSWQRPNKKRWAQARVVAEEGKITE